MSQSKETARESQPDATSADDPTAVPRRGTLLVQLRNLLDERARLLEQLAKVDREIDRVRAEASDDARREAERLRDSPDDRTCIVQLQEFVRGAVDPPDGVDRDDFESCVGKVVLALRRRGESLARKQVQVRFQADSGRVVAIALRVGEGVSGEQQLYRRFELGALALSD